MQTIPAQSGADADKLRLITGQATEPDLTAETPLGFHCGNSQRQENPPGAPGPDLGLRQRLAAVGI